MLVLKTHIINGVIKMSGERGNNKSFQKSVSEEERFNASQMKKAAELRTTLPMESPSMVKSKGSKKLNLSSSKQAIVRKLSDL